MAVSGSPKKVELITQSLADYLRFSMTDGEIDQAPLEEELKALDGYLQVEKIRFAENLEYRIDATPETRASNVPRALVQPLIENAIKYGQQTSAMPLRITIHAQLISDSIHLIVENTGSWVERNPKTSMGIGLKNLSRRLSLLYGGRATIRHERSTETVKVIVTIPIVRNFPSNT
jgi:LytS/YehU family sensor histidine kinase